MIELDLELMAHFVVAGIIYAAVGYLKSQKPFDPAKFGKTLGVGAFAGLLAPYIGLDLERLDFETLATSAGVIYLLQSFGQALLRKRVAK